jgi:hypothetical protein
MGSVASPMRLGLSISDVQIESDLKMASRGRSIRRTERGGRDRRETTQGMTPEFVAGMTWGEWRRQTVAASAEGFARVAEEMEASAERFRAQFGRDPEADDPVMWDPDAPTPQPMTAERLRADMLSSMREAGISPPLIYGYQKTGLLLSHSNQHLMSRRQINAWNDAMIEWEQIEEWLVMGEPDPRPITLWTIRAEFEDDVADLDRLLDESESIADLRARGMTMRIDADNSTVFFETRDPHIAAAMAHEHGILWHRSEAQGDNADIVEAEALCASGRYKLHFITVMPFTSELRTKMKNAIETAGFDWAEELAGPMRPDLDQPVRIQMWFTATERPPQEAEAALCATLASIHPNICVIDEIDPLDFCNRVVIPGMAGMDKAYLNAGLGMLLVDEPE